MPINKLIEINSLSEITGNKNENNLGVTLKDALIINNWLFFAKKIGDKSVFKISNNLPYSKYMDKLLTKKILDNIKFN